MPADTLSAFEPRKTPVQARSAVTVEAITEATIQVLLSHGGDRLTTTLVAERAGVSVGTLYQYYPNKDALLFAVLEAAMNRTTAAVEKACEEARRKPLAAMVQHVVEAFVNAKMNRPDISVALYQISANTGGPALVKKALQRQRKALDAMFQTASDTDAPPDKFTIDIMCAAMAGVMKSVLEAGPTPALVRRLREQLVLLCQSYLTAAIRQ